MFMKIIPKNTFYVSLGTCPFTLFIVSDLAFYQDLDIQHVKKTNILQKVFVKLIISHCI